MSGEQTVTSYAGLLKPVIEQGYHKVLPESAILQRLASFESASKTGNSYEFLVNLQRPATHKFGGSAPAALSALTAFSPGVSSRASAQGSEYMLFDRIEYSLLSRSASDAQAVQNGFKHFIEIQRDAARYALEVVSLHGGRMIAEVASLSSQVITVDRFAPAIIANLVGCTIDTYQSDGTTSRQADLVVTAVDPEASATTATITVTGTTTNIADGDLVFFDGTLGGSSPGSQFGLFQQAAASSGTMFGIAKTSPAWRAGSYAAGGALTTTKVMEIAAKSVNRGNPGGKGYLLINPNRFASLAGLIAAQRSYDQSFAERESINGVEAITIRCGSIRTAVTGHPYVFQSEGLFCPADELVRIGSSDLRVGNPSVTAEEAVWHVPGTNTCEMTMFADFQTLSKRQAHMILVTGVTA